jgi:hypothetical protein
MRLLGRACSLMTESELDMCLVGMPSSPSYLLGTRNRQGKYAEPEIQRLRWRHLLWQYRACQFQRCSSTLQDTGQPGLLWQRKDLPVLLPSSRTLVDRAHRSLSWRLPHSQSRFRLGMAPVHELLHGSSAQPCNEASLTWLRWLDSSNQPHILHLVYQLHSLYSIDQDHKQHEWLHQSDSILLVHTCLHPEPQFPASSMLLLQYRRNRLDKVPKPTWWPQ